MVAAVHEIGDVIGVFVYGSNCLHVDEVADLCGACSLLVGRECNVKDAPLGAVVACSIGAAVTDVLGNGQQQVVNVLIAAV